MLLAKLAGAMKASLSKAVYLFAAPLSQAARAVDALRAKVEASGPVADAPADVAEVAQETTDGTDAVAPTTDGTDAVAPTTGGARRRVHRNVADEWRRAGLIPPGDRPHHHNATHGIRTKERTPIMAKLSTDELLEAFKEMTLIELSEFVKQFEETFERHRCCPGRRRGRRPPPVAATPPSPRSRTSSTSSSRPLVTRRSRSSRRSAR